MALCKTTVLKVYNQVIEDVIAGVREIFTDEGLDEQVLVELKMLWESKLMASKAVDSNPDNPDAKSSTAKKSDTTGNNASGFNQQIKQQTQQQFGKLAVAQQVSQPAPVPVVQAPVEDKMIPIQITLPAQPTIDSATRVLTIHVPASALNGPQLHTLLTGPVITATMGLPAAIASSLLQQHVNAALQQQQQQQQAQAVAVTSTKTTVQQADGEEKCATLEADPSFPMISLDMPFFSSLPSNVVPDASNKNLPYPSGSGFCSIKSPTLGQERLRRVPKKARRKNYITIEIACDGHLDTSDEDEDGSEDEVSDDEVDDDKEDDDQDGVDDNTNEEEPLNSGDDVTDEEPSDLFDTDNVVVCQYDKITRSRNKWKFYLKDGIMNLDGEDFVFQKANGDAEW